MESRAVNDATRKAWLTWTAGGMLALLAADRLLWRPAARAWSAQSQRIAALREQVAQGRLARDRIETVRRRWAEAVERSLPPDGAAGEERMLKAIHDEAREARIALTALNPRWRKETGGFEVLECRVTAQGDWGSLARWLDAMENARPAIRLEAFDLAPRDDRGSRLTLTARFSALQIADRDREYRP